jgi:hypothetical protein
VATQERAVAANRRLTAVAAGVLFVLLAAEGLTIPDVRDHLPQHLFIGLLLVPPLGVKLASVAWRAARYHARDPAYRRAGPPAPLMRLLAPLVVLTTVAVLATGIELWLFGLRFGAVWIAAHKLSFVAWFLVTAVHVLAYLERAGRETLADLGSRSDVPGAISRRSLLGASLLLGLVLALVTVLWPGPFTVFPETG